MARCIFSLREILEQVVDHAGFGHEVRLAQKRLPTEALGSSELMKGRRSREYSTRQSHPVYRGTPKTRISAFEYDFHHAVKRHGDFQIGDSIRGVIISAAVVSPKRSMPSSISSVVAACALGYLQSLRQFVGSNIVSTPS